MPTEQYRNAYREGFGDGYRTGNETEHDGGGQSNAREKADQKQDGGNEVSGVSTGDDSGHGAKDDASNDAKHDGNRSDEDHDVADKDGKSGKQDDKKKGPGKLPLIILAVVVVLLVIAGFIYWFAHRNEESTDDAFIDGNAVTIAPKVSGYVVELNVNDNVRVRKGDLLLRIDPRDYATALAQSKAQLGLAQADQRSAQIQLSLARVQAPAQLAQAVAQRESAQASLAKAAASAARQHSVDARATSQENIDAADAQQRSAEANVSGAQAQVKSASLVPEQLHQVAALVDQRAQQVEQARAQVAQSELSLSYTEILAPSDGWVTRRNVQLGSYLQAGAQVMAIVTPEIWVTANLKESQLERVRVGQKVRIKVDAYPQLDLHGHIDSVQLGSGSRFSAFPAENATGNFVKIVQRVPVKIVVDSGLDANFPLPLGLSVVPVIDLQ